MTSVPDWARSSTKWFLKEPRQMHLIEGLSDQDFWEVADQWFPESYLLHRLLVTGKVDLTINWGGVTGSGGWIDEVNQIHKSPPRKRK